MSEGIEKIKFVDEETNDEIWFEVIDEVILEDTKYILVVDEDDISTILKQVNEADDEVEYTLVEDEDEFKKVATEFMTSEDYDIEV
ncbi:MAG: DUF1292 domain-containing protein [Candidatus Cellulosilyticum pullistercoris]|uniref:DUF1292 domain-containing protein n=1 Tax=Candidatus Cellulosilyticum pullistercoris TaxID=2838521 RepID=A0A9E2NLI5_9FIRM|nr:DUF1292 domain-containing protein [Candidatus Cellulosilyticum pullistercoris]